jgi:hypothetical protein
LEVATGQVYMEKTRMTENGFPYSFFLAAPTIDYRFIRNQFLALTDPTNAIARPEIERMLKKEFYTGKYRWNVYVVKQFGHVDTLS